MEIFVSLAQPDGRGVWIDGKPIKFPFNEVINPILFTVLHVPFNPAQPKSKPQLLTRFDEKLVKGVSVLKQHKEVSLRLKVPQGFVYIVPSIGKAGKTGEFILSIYFNKHKNKIHFHRLDRPQDSKYSIIREEEDNANNVPDWKISLTENRIKFMIQEEDDRNEISESVKADARKLGEGRQIKLGSALKKLAKKPNNTPARGMAGMGRRSGPSRPGPVRSEPPKRVLEDDSFDGYAE
jgi:Calpain large subunit, domain III